jgi:nucleotide-binding universal stress UspA family protein
LILGSVSLQVATDARCSVRIGRGGPAQTDRQDLRIVIGLDSSPGAETAVRKVLGRAWPQGTELRIVAVDDGVSSITTDVLSVSDKHIGEDTSVSVGRIVKLAAAKGLTVSAGVIKGNPLRVLLAEARSWEADCIVIGSRSGNALQGFFSSSVSVGLAANAECSIEIVR